MINWFEGGRRFSRLLMQVVALAGAAYVVIANEAEPTLAVRGPTMPWFVANEDCRSPSFQRHLSTFDWGGSEPGLALCFLALDNGQIPYAVASPMDEEELRQARQEAEGHTRPDRGGSLAFNLSPTRFHAAGASDARVQHYADRSVESFNLTPQLRNELHESHWAFRWRAHKKAFRDAAPWVLGFCAFIWINATALGLLARGLAGVPVGRDSRGKARDGRPGPGDRR